MILVDLYLPDDLPITADADLGQAVAGLIDDLPDFCTVDPCLVYVHRQPVFGVVTAATEGIRVVRLQLSVSGRVPAALRMWLRELVLRYLYESTGDEGTAVVVSIVPLETSVRA